MRHEERSQAVVEVAVQPMTSWYASDDERWIAQVSELRTALTSEVGGLRTPPITPGTKGVGEMLAPLVVALSGRPVLGALVDVLDLWLSRDRHRSVELALSGPDGHQQKLTVRGNGMRSAEVEHALIEALATLRRQ